MRIIDMLNSSRQLVFETSYQGYEYSARGTGFLCRYRGYDFVITARHVIAGFMADQLRVLFHQNATDFVPHNAQITIKTPNIKDTDWADLAIFPLERSLYTDELFQDQRPYPLAANTIRSDFGKDGHLIMRGFPHDLSAVDYDSAVIRQKATILEADYVGKAPMAHCHELAFRDLSPCTTLDGLSGTPLFWIGNEQPRPHGFAGLMLRATYTSHRGYFLEPELIMSALDKALAA